MKLKEYFIRYARGRGVQMADRLAARIRAKLSNRSPLPPARAIPHAPPRLRSGRLRGSVKVRRTLRGATLMVGAPYGRILENSTTPKGFPHRFVRPSMKELGLI